MKKLNFGCGTDIKKGYLNVDIQKGKGIDLSFGFNKFPYPLKDNTFDYVLVDNVLEHLDDIDKIMMELRRICKNNAIIYIRVPYWNCFYAYGDYTHKHYFNELSFEVICNKCYKRDKTRKFEIVELKLIPQRFIKFLPHNLLRILSRIFNNIFIQIEVKMKVIK